MRDPARIRAFLAAFQAEWEQHPDLRFGQLVEIIHSMGPVGGADIFNLEDKDWQQRLQDLQTRAARK